MLNYLIWADQKVFVFIDQLNEKALDFRLQPNGISIRETLIHIAEDHWEWYQDLRKNYDKNIPNFRKMTPNALRDRIFKNNARWLEIFNNPSQESWIITRNGKNRTMSIDELVFHICNHATYHRGQLAMKLRLLGKDIPYLDYVPYRFE